MSVTEDIKARLDIVNFISQYATLKKAGRNYTALCPFHSERTPSFIVFPDSQSWRCFGSCGEGGDIFNFVMKREALDFVGAMRFLAEKAGVELHDRSPEQVNHEERLDKLRGLLEETARFFHDKLLKSPTAEHARAYVHKRGLNDDTINNFMIGYAPKDWRQALDHLTHLGYSDDDVVAAGVAIRSDAGRIYDRFRHRLMIPIHDGRGKVIGFGARALDPDDNPKYLNSPQSEIFDKGATLFGLHLARRTIRETETAIIVEGYMDAIQAHQAGFSNVVAQMGTALTEPQLKQLSKYARILIMALDPDAAGAKATMRGLNVIREKSDSTDMIFDPGAMMRRVAKLDVDLRVMTLPDGQDPDDVIRDHPEQWTERVRQATPVADYVIQVGTAHLTPQSPIGDREKAARDLLPILLATDSDLQRYSNVQRLALRLRLNERALIEMAQRNQNATPHITKNQPKQPHVGQATSPEKAIDAGLNPALNGQGSQSAAAATKALSRVVSSLERYCLAVLLQNPGWLSMVDRRLRQVAEKMNKDHTRVEAGKPPPAKPDLGVLGPLSAQDFLNPDYRAIFDTLEQAVAQYQEDPKDYVEEHLPYELRIEIQTLGDYLQNDLDNKLPDVMQADTARIKADIARVRPEEKVIEEELTRLELRTLELRKRRLQRENIELQYLQQDADSVSDQEYGRRVLINKKAIGHIELTLRQLMQRN